MTFQFLAGGGEMGKAVAATDWSATPLGPIEGWSQSLRTTVSLCLASNFPISLVWGSARNQIYNDGYRPICGAKHPHSLGQDFRECWASAWPVIGEAFESAENGEARFLENQRMFLDRNGYLEETFFTFSFSPIRDESGGIGGLFHPVTETTARMLSERRTKALRDLATRCSKAASVDEACLIAQAVMAESDLDVPFSMVYLLDATGTKLSLCGAGPELDSKKAPDCLHLGDSESTWPVRLVLDSGQAVSMENFAERMGLSACGPYPEAPDTAMVLPIPRPGMNRQAGVLVAGVSSRLPLDDAYRDFYDLLARQLAGAIANARAYEEERRRSEALAELDRAKTQFFSNVSHEFRTPLTLMLGPLADLLGHPGATVAVSRDELDMIQRNGLHLLRLVNTLLDFSRIEAGRVQAVFEPVDLSALTADLASVFRATVEKAGLTFTALCPPLSQPVYVDRSMWEKLILNLLSNAFKFTFEGGIRIAVRETSQSAVVEVSDTGTGIPPAALPHLFERFYRVEAAQGRTYEGSGIGLALVQELVRLHAGVVEVESELGVGSTFRITLPLGSAHLPAGQVKAEPDSSGAADSATARGFADEALRWLPENGAGESRDPHTGSDPHAGSGPATGAKSARILLADDNADMRHYVARILNPEYEVVAVPNGAEALRVMQEDPCDLVLSDVMMPGLDGFGLLAALRQDERTRSIPVILLSARAGEEARVEGLDAGADDYLVKPFGARELLARVRTNVDLARLRDEIPRHEEHRRSLEAVERQRRLMDTALSNTQDLIYIFDVEGRFTYVNRLVLQLWNKTAEEAVGRNMFEMGYEPELARKLHDQVLEVVATSRPSMHQTPYAGADGVTREYEYGLIPVIGADGQVEAVAGTSRDVTDRRRAEAEEREREARLRESARLESLGLLAGGVAHDFNNLLVGVIGNASLAQEMISPSHPAADLIASVLKIGDKAALLTRQMLAYSGKGKFMVEAIDLSQLVGDMVGLVRPSIARKVELRLDLAQDLPAIEVDPGQVQQVFMNLALNAAEAIGSNQGHIAIKTGVREFDDGDKTNRTADVGDVPSGKCVYLEVRDTGSGMDEATKARIFDPFFSTKFVGRGLGLAAVAGIIRGHKGSIAVTSTPGAGTCFTVLFPAAARTARAARVDAGHPLRGSGTVLVVDDEPIVREFTKRALERYGYTVLVAEGGPAALDVFKRHPGEIALVILDLSMPQMSGEEVLPELRKIRPGVRVVIASGYSESETLELFAGQRVSGFVPKPFTSNTIAEKVKECLQ